MLEATLAFLSGPVADFTVAGHKQGLSGNQAVSRNPTANLFKTGEGGHVLLAVNNEKQFKALMKALGREDVLSSPLGVWDKRIENEPELRKVIEGALAAKGAREWEKILDAGGAPAASIWKVEEVIDHPQITARKALQEIDTPFGRKRYAGTGFQLAHGNAKLERMAPTLSAHTDEVLTEAGYSKDEIAALHQAEAV
jgi:crotonobetainyl-CoA:carnitine CoA-transferase CaiB-like acyl-CoA transferase